MRHNFICSHIHFFIFILFCIIWLPVIAESSITGDLVLKVYIVDDLKLNPIPLKNFRITRQEDNKQILVRTDETGKLTVTLSKGDYLIENINPIGFKGQNYQWSQKITIDQNKICELILTDEDAIINGIRGVSTEGDIYKRYIGGVVTVESETGRGTGFLVDQSGLILTNSHVVENSKRFVVKFGPGQRYPAVKIDTDTEADIAVLWFAIKMNPKAPILQLSNQTNVPLAIVGEHVCAIGSPLNQEQILTSGIISKISNDVIISDVNINHGNSGGPLLNMKGEVIGLNTYGPAKTSGPGYAGIVPITKAIPVLINAKIRLDSVNQEKPEARELPDVSRIKIPIAAMEEAAKSDLSVFDLDEISDFAVYLKTPMISLSQTFANERNLEREHQNKSKDKNMEIEVTRFKDYDKRDAIVSIIVDPKLKKNEQSFFGSLFSGKSNKDEAKKTKYSYVDEFIEMKLFRDGKLIEPVRYVRKIRSVNTENANEKAVDYAYNGQYDYDPLVFEPSLPLVLKINTRNLNDKNADWAIIRIDSKTQKKIWDSFILWRLELEKNTTINAN